ncbi:MAG: hypothetical protein K2K60_04215 [Clostridia bacterium]|nr:hypothetical protein [Clostridia bacterium]
MKEIDIEEQLKRSAEKIELDDFEAHWEKLKPEIGEDFVIKRSFNKRFWVPFFSAVCLAIALSIIIPIALNKPETPPRFFNVNELTTFEATEATFYEELAIMDIEYQSFSSYNVDEYYVFETVDQEIKGGQIFIIDDSGYYASFAFYDKSIIIGSTEGPEVQTVILQNIEVKYYTYVADSLFQTSASLTIKNLNYQIGYYSLQDNFLEFIDDFLAKF